MNTAEARYIVDEIERHARAGLPLKQQAVLFRSSHHSLAVELELARRRLSFHKFGGLKFADAAHVKDLVAFLRLAENGRDMVAGLRLLKLLPGIGPKKAQTILADLILAGGQLDWLAGYKVPKTTLPVWPAFVGLLQKLTQEPPLPVAEQIRLVVKYYTPVLRETYDEPEERLDDLKKLHELADRYEDRAGFLAELRAGPASLDTGLGQGRRQTSGPYCPEHHSLRQGSGVGCGVCDQCHAGWYPFQPGGNPAQLDEELRLFYVALTRAKTWLTVTYPALSQRHPEPMGQLGPPVLTSFLPKKVRRLFAEDRA